MKVMHILSSPTAGGAEIYVKDLAIEQAKAGDTVSIAFFQSASESNRSIEFEHAFLCELDRYGITYHFVGKKARRNLVWGARRFRAILTQSSAEIVHSHLYWGIILIALSGRKKFSVVYTHHSIKLKCPKWMYFIWNLIVDEYIGICFACTRLLKSTPAKCVSTIYNAVNSERLILHDDCYREGNEKVTLFAVGRLVYEKDYETLIKALSLLNRKDFLMKIAGEGPEETALREQAAQLGLSENISFMGNIGNVNKALAKSDVFVMASRWEGLPIALLEATLTGLPVVVTNVGGCAEVVGAVGHGFVAEPGNAEQLAKLLARLIEDKTLRDDMRKRAKAYSACYDIDAAFREHSKLYRALLK